MEDLPATCAVFLLCDLYKGSVLFCLHTYDATHFFDLCAPEKEREQLHASVKRASQGDAE